MTSQPTGTSSPVGRPPGRVRGLFLDTAPLRYHREYRALWIGQVVSGTGNQITRIVLPFQVFVLTGSTLAIGVLVLVQLIPILVFSLGAGSVADAVDRRKILFVTLTGSALMSLALVFLAMIPTPPLVAIYVVAFLAAGFGSVDSPTRSAAIPRLVSRDRLPAAIALNQLNFQTASIVGPALGGVLLATVGVAGAYAVDVLSFGASLAALLVIGPLPPIGQAAKPGIDAIVEGLRFARQHRIILSTFAIDLVAMIFGMPTALFPVLALDVFKVGPIGVGLLAAAPGVGAFAGALLSGWVSRVRRAGRAVVVAVVVWGAAIAAFGLATFSFPLALLFLAIAGGADVLSAVFRSTIVQLEAPDQLRGRVQSIHALVVTSGPRLGDLEATGVAAIWGAQLSVVSGGLLCLLGVGVVARAFPELWQSVLPGRGRAPSEGDDAA
jgi:MFS family permease